MLCTVLGQVLVVDHGELLERPEGVAGYLRLGLEANEKNFKALAGGKNRYIHVAGHGTLGEGGAGEPALVFSLVGNEEGKEDGFLTMSEVLGMDIGAEMVVLSACKTGQGDMEKGEGVAGLSRAFLYSGADSLVVSLWEVADEETKQFMVGFYDKLIDNQFGFIL